MKKIGEAFGDIEFYIDPSLKEGVVYFDQLGSQHAITARDKETLRKVLIDHKMNIPDFLKGGDKHG